MRRPRCTPVKAFYSDRYVLPLPPGHRFPMAKYRMLRERVADLPGIRLLEPPAATDAELGLAHAPAYVRAVAEGSLEPLRQREIGFPWSPEMVERSRRSVGATISACRAALEEGVAVNLAGGTHHAGPDRGGGFCVFNDAAVAARLMLQEGRVRRVAIVDLDVHQGNGTAAILRGDARVFTLSMHGEKNYPFRKEASDLDVGLPDGCDDDTYLAALDAALDRVWASCAPELIVYLAGADCHEGDRLGRLGLSFAGLLARDRRVLSAARERRIPCAVAMAGGYGRVIEDTVRVHAQTVGAAMRAWRAWPPAS